MAQKTKTRKIIEIVGGFGIVENATLKDGVMVARHYTIIRYSVDGFSFDPFITTRFSNFQTALDWIARKKVRG